MKDNKSNISLLVFLSYAYKGLLIIILSLSIAIYKIIKYIYLGIHLLFKVNYTIIKKSIETIKNDNLQANNEKQLSLASKKTDNVKVIPNMAETKKELPWRKTKNNNKTGTRNIKPNDFLLEKELPLNENIVLSDNNNNLIKNELESKPVEIEVPKLTEEPIDKINKHDLNKKLPWWKRIDKNKNKEIIPIEENKVEELQPQLEEIKEEPLNLNEVEEIPQEKIDLSEIENITEDNKEISDENIDINNTSEEYEGVLNFESENTPSLEENLNTPIMKMENKKLPWWKRIGKKKKEEINPIKENKVEELQPSLEEIKEEPFNLNEAEEITQEKIDKISEITSDELEFDSMDKTGESKEETTQEKIDKINEITSDELEFEPMDKIGESKEEINPYESLEKENTPSLNEDIDIPIIEIEEKKLPWWKRIGKKKNAKIIPIEEDIDIPIIEIEEKKLPWWKKFGKNKNEEIIPIEENKVEESQKEKADLNEIEDTTEDNKEISDEKIDIKDASEDELEFKSMDSLPLKEDIDIPIIEIEEKKLPWWKKFGKKKNESINEDSSKSEELFEFEPMDKIGESKEEILENKDENISDLFKFESEDNISNSDDKENNIEEIFKESDEKTAREYVNKREQKKAEKRKLKEEKRKRKEEIAREKARKKNNKNTYINENVKLEKTPFKQKIKDIGVGFSTAAVSLSDKLKNNIFSKDRRNKRDLKRKVLLIDFEGKDAEKTENKLLYEYVAKDRNGKIVKDYFNAYSKVEVHSYLLSEGYEVYSIKTNKLIQLLHASSNTNKTRFKNKDLIFFLTQLSTYLKAGIPLVDSLRIVARQYKKKNYQKIFRSIIYELSVGENFSSAMEKQNNAFPKLLINMVKTAEMTGSLPEVLDDMAEYYTEAEATRKQMITAMTYPLIVFTFAICVMIFIMVYVVPKFVQIYDTMEDVELPGITKTILGISSFIRHYYIFLILGVILLIILSIVAYRKVKQFRTMCQWLLMKIPVIKNTIIYNEVTMFTKTFSSLLAHNVPITDSMEILNQITNNEIYKMLILDTITNLAKGGKISDAFKDHWAFPVPAYEMIVTGEATGELAEMMSKVSSYYQELHKNSVTRIKTFIEPVLTIFLTVGVGIIILSVILPMFNMYSAVTDLGE